jgi:hypothetical protein
MPGAGNPASTSAQAVIVMFYYNYSIKVLEDTH